jgi:prevent-host-death family protein
MLIETLSVREAREQLPRVLERSRHGDRTPVPVSAHSRAEAVMVPIEVFEELTAERARSSLESR